MSPRLLLRCPYCLQSSTRPLGFVRARGRFVCDHCREIVRIDQEAVAAALARLPADAGGPVEVQGRALSV